MGSNTTWCCTCTGNRTGAASSSSPAAKCGYRNAVQARKKCSQSSPQPSKPAYPKRMFPLGIRPNRQTPRTDTSLTQPSPEDENASSKEGTMPDVNGSFSGKARLQTAVSLTDVAGHELQITEI